MASRTAQARAAYLTTSPLKTASQVRRHRYSMSTRAGAVQPRVFFSKYDVTEQVFLRTPHVIGIVNLKPIVPCHVLLIPPSPEVRRLSQLPPDSVGTFFRATQLVVSKLESALGATSSNVAIQDGADAGQSVPHLHVHILPRRKGDFAQSDDVYDELDNWGWSELHLQQLQPGTVAVDDEQRRLRSMDEMKAEASWLRRLFADCAWETL